MTEHGALDNPEITTLYVVTDTVIEYVNYVRKLGAVIVHPSQAAYKLGRFMLRWLNPGRIKQQLQGIAPEYAMVILGPNWKKAEERLPELDEGSLRMYLTVHRFKIASGSELKNYEGAGL